MINKFEAISAIEEFNDYLKNAEKSNDFAEAISRIVKSRESITRVEEILRTMRQEEHDLTNDIYNRFKNKEYVKKIKF